MKQTFSYLITAVLAFTFGVSIAYAADTAISALTPLTGATTADDDDLVIVDTSATQTKKITVSELGLKIRETEGNVFRVRDYGAVGDGTTNDDTAFTDTRTAACAISGPKTILLENGDFELNGGNVIQLCDDLVIECRNATITVPSSATATDTVATDLMFDNGLFYVADDATLDNVTIKGCTLNSAKDEIGLLQIGSTQETVLSTTLRNNIKLIDNKQSGGSGWIVRRTDNLDMRGNEISEVVNMCMYNSALSHSEIHSNTFEYCGVDTGLTTFANASAINLNNSNTTKVHDNSFLWSGGTSVIARASTLDVFGMEIYDNLFEHCGESCAGISVPSFAVANRRVYDSRIEGNTVRGWISQDDSSTPGQSHAAFSIGVDQGTGFAENVSISENNISFLGPDETWDNVAFDIAGTVENDLKDHEASAGNVEAIQIFSEDGDAYTRNFRVNDNVISYTKRTAILIDRSSTGIINGNTIHRAGWERNASNVPTGTSHAIFVSLAADVNISGNVVTDHGPGVDGDSSVSTFIYSITDSHNVKIANNTGGGYATNSSSAATAFGGVFFNGTADGLYVGIDDYDAADRVSLIAANNEFKNTFLTLVNSLESNYRMQDQGDLTVLSDSQILDYNNTVTLEEGILHGMYNGSGGHTWTLPDPTYHPATPFSVKNIGTGVLTIASTGGSINGSASLSPGQGAEYLAHAGIWQEMVDSDELFFATETTTNPTTAVVGQTLPVNSTSSVIEIDQPASPSAGDTFRVIDSRGTAGTNNITVDFTDPLHGTVQDYIIDVDGRSVTFEYINSTIGWVAEQ